MADSTDGALLAERADGRAPIERRRIALNTAWQTIAFGLAVGAKAVAGILVARTHGPAGVGVFSLAWSVAGMLAFAAQLGLDNRLVREMARRRDVAELEATLPLATISSLLVGAAVAFVPWAAGVSASTATAMAGAGLFVALSGPVLVLRAGFHACERMDLETASIGVEGAIGFTAAAVLVHLDAGVGAVIAAFALARIGNIAFALHGYRRLHGRRVRLVWLPARWSPLLRSSVALGITYLLTSVMVRFDLVAVALFRGDRDLGIYSAATVVILAAPVLVTSLAASVYPTIARTRGRDDPELDEVVNRTWSHMAWLAVPGAALLAAAAGPIIAIAYGDEFTDSVGLLAMMAWLLPIRLLNNLTGLTLAALDHTGREARVVGWAVAVNLVANLALVPVFGIAGAVATSFVTELALCAVLLRALRPLRIDVLGPLLTALPLAAAVAVATAATPGPAIVHVLPGAVVLVAGVGARRLTDGRRLRTIAS